MLPSAAGPADSLFHSQHLAEVAANLGQPSLHPELTRHAGEFVLLSKRLFLSLIQSNALNANIPAEVESQLSLVAGSSGALGVGKRCWQFSNPATI